VRVRSTLPAGAPVHAAMFKCCDLKQAVETALAALGEDDLKCYQGDLERAGQFKMGEHIVTSAMVEIKPQQKRLTGRCPQATSSSCPHAVHIPTERKRLMSRVS